MNYIKEIKSRFTKDGYIKDVSILTGGTILAQIVPLIFYPILSRIYTPSDFGVLSSILAIANILTNLSTGKYERSIIITENKMIAINIVALVLILTLGILSVLLIFSYVFYDYLGFIYGDIQNRNMLFVPFLISFFVIIYQSYNEWCVKYKYFKNVSYNKILNGAASPIFQFSIGSLKIFSPIGLLIGDVIGKGVSALNCTLSFASKDINLLKYVTLKRIKLYALKYIDFPKFILPAQLLNVIGSSIPILAIGYFFNVKEVGYFSMANMVLVLPSTIVGKAMADAFRNKASEIYLRTGNCRYLYKKNVLMISIISLIGYSLLYTIAPSLFDIALGSEWRESGVYARILMPIIAVSIVSEVVASMFIIAEKMKIGLYWQILYLITSVLPFIFAYWIKDIYVILIIYTICKMFAHIVNLILTYRFTINKLKVQ